MVLHEKGNDLELLSFALAQIAVEAGALIMSIYGQTHKTYAQVDSTPVCEADARSEALILSRLAHVCPGVPVVAEEQTSRGIIPDLRREFIVVDPLDGTREFASRNGEFTINIAFIRNNASVCGAVYAPAIGRLWLASKEASVCKVQPGGVLPGRKDMKKIHVRSLDGRPPVAVVSRSHFDANTAALIHRLGARRFVKGSALKFCLVAAGRADIYPRLGPTMAWDVAAGAAVLRAAGGTVAELKGMPISYGLNNTDFRIPNFVAVGDTQLLADLKQ